MTPYEIVIFVMKKDFFPKLNSFDNFDFNKFFSSISLILSYGNNCI